MKSLLSLLLPGHGRLRTRIEEVLDLPLIQQQAENQALDIGQLAQFIVGMMATLCAPQRDGEIQKLREIFEENKFKNLVDVLAGEAGHDKLLKWLEKYFKQDNNILMIDRITQFIKFIKLPDMSIRVPRRL